MKLSRNLMLGASLAGLLVAVAGGQALFHQNVIGTAHAQGGDVMVPTWKADPYWPKPMPHGWILGQTIGLSNDKAGNLWVVHRPQTMEKMETLAARDEAACCTPAPDILEFNPAGELINFIDHKKIGLDHDWPSSNHGAHVGPDGNLYISGQGAPPPGPCAACAANYAKKAPGEGGGEKGLYYDSFLLKVSPDGKFLGEIGTHNGSKGSLDMNNIRGTAQVRFLPDGTGVLADGYGNHRVALFDAKAMKITKIWGAYGKPPTDEPLPQFNVDLPQFGNPVHCAVPSNDGMLYVCDRMNDRVQVFKFDGTYLHQFVIDPETKGEGSTWKIAFTNDPAQKFMLVDDGSSMKVHVLDRKSEKELFWFGGGGRQPGQFYAPHSVQLATTNVLYTSETFHGQRVQKWDYQGLKPLSAVLKAKYIGNTQVGGPGTKPE